MTRKRTGIELTPSRLEIRSLAFIVGDLVGWSIQCTSYPSSVALIESVVGASREADASNFCLGLLFGMSREEEPQIFLVGAEEEGLEMLTPRINEGLSGSDGEVNAKPVPIANPYELAIGNAGEMLVRLWEREEPRAYGVAD